ncbi:glycosyltransferase [Arthrobacter sp. MA-N2]|uniref:glycosyltransferase n=1 Tax=Arthrobacter sp. MA-N2 TaxID=1101188 RepID=UPI001E2F2183|nr:glycosyltransferase [Arthrobacter sp. MA-N2]
MTPPQNELMRRDTPIVTLVNEHLRITIIGLNYAPEPTGNAPYTTSLADGLAAAGHSISVITGYPHYPEWKLKQGYTGWKRLEVLGGVNVKRLRHFIPKKPRVLQRMHMELSFGLRAILASWECPDVVLVVSPGLFSSAMAILRARLSPRRPRVVIWVQDIYSRGVVETGAGGQRLGVLMSKTESLILRSVDAVVAIHDRFQQYMVEYLGVPEKRIRVIRNWTHLPASPTSGLHAFRTRMGWSPDDVVVLHAGNMGKKQGLENVVDAAALAATGESRVRFILMGNGNQRPKLEALAKKDARLEFVDTLPDDQFQRALAAADVLLVNELPGVKDMAVPSKLTSYFNSGVAVVAATDEGSVTASEIQASGGGITVPAGAPDKLLSAIEALTANPDECRQMGRNGLHFRQVTLSESAAIAQYDEFLARLASQRSL